MKVLKYSLFVLAATLLAMKSQTVLADNVHRVKTYTITITNITRGQIFSPPVVVVHNRNFKLFDLGSIADKSLYSLAEDGMTGPLVNYVSGMQSVYGSHVAAGPVRPGESLSMDVEVRGRYRFISVAGMLVSTNDAFFAVRGLPVNLKGMKSVSAEAYDAGSEANSEECSYIPGPPCGNGGVRNTEGAEGYIHVHGGIHGVADLDPATKDWRNPVAEVTVYSKY